MVWDEKTMKPKKPKPNQPSARDKLAAKFDADLLADYELHGPEAIAAAREKSPEKYLETVNRRSTEAKADSAIKDVRTIVIDLLKDAGMTEDMMSENDITDATKARETLINVLLAIKDRAQGLVQ
jgi:hypothetical protein